MMWQHLLDLFLVQLYVNIAKQHKAPNWETWSHRQKNPVKGDSKENLNKATVTTTGEDQTAYLILIDKQKNLIELGCKLHGGIMHTCIGI